jgi:uncharacterized SAM-binding protein YcdF (DUF218 family)
MRGGAPRIEGSVVSATIDVAGRPERTLRWRLSTPPPTVSGDVLLPALLPLAMRTGERLRLDAPVSPRLLCSSHRAQELVLGWDAEVRARVRTRRPPQQRVDIDAATRSIGTRRPGAAAFFTAGVDSFHTALAHLDELDALVYVHGFDVGLDQRGLRSRVIRGVRNAAEQLGKPLVEVECDLRDVSDRIIGWDAYNGAALAGVAHLLSPWFGTLHIPATLTLRRLVPLGSHPELDPLWSSEEMVVHHDGADTERLDKLRRVAEHPAAAASLRVCWENRDGAYNCGRCEKCMRTMVGLAALGKLGDFETFPPFEVRHVNRVLIPKSSGSRARSWSGALDALDASGHDPELARAVRLRQDRLDRIPRPALATGIAAAKRARTGVRRARALRTPRVAAAEARRLTRYLDLDTGVGPDHVDLAIVFGSESAQPALIAADVLRAGQTDWLLVTGGRSRTKGHDEARRALEAIRADGVSTERVLVEEQSTTTLENVALSLPLVEEHLPLDRLRTMLVVAKWHHSRRAVSLLRRHLPPEVGYSVMAYEPATAPRGSWHLSARGRRTVLDEWHALRAALRTGSAVDVGREGDVWR